MTAKKTISAKKARRRRPQLRKGGHIAVSSDSLKAAVLHLVNLAIWYEVAHGGTRYMGSTLAVVGEMSRAEKVLSDVVETLGQHERELKSYVNAVRAADFIPTLRDLLVEHRALAPEEREGAEALLRARIDQHFCCIEIPLPKRQLDKIIGAANGRDDYLTKRLERAVGGVLGFSGEHVANLRRALYGQPRREARVKSQGHAEALLNEEGVVPGEVLGYFLDALTRGCCPDLVEEILKTWRNHWEQVRTRLLPPATSPP